jgi:O-antigen/teichoic acid export membrane protein
MSDGKGIRDRLLHGGFWAVGARGVGILSALAVNALLARLLSPADMGNYFLTMSVAGLAAIVAQFGMPSAVVRFVAEAMGTGRAGRARSAVMHALLITAAGGILAGLLYFALLGGWVSNGLFHAPGMAQVIGLTALIMAGLALQGVLCEVFRGFHDIRLASLLGTTSTSLFSACIFALLWLSQGHADLSQTLQLSLAAMVLTFVLSFILLGRRMHGLDGDGDIGMREMAMTGAPLCVAAVTVFAATQGDLWVVGAMLPGEDAAVYGAVLRLLALVTVTHGIVVAVTQSTIAELFGQDRRFEMQAVVQGGAFWACLVSGVVLLLYVLFGGTVLKIVFGGSYTTGYTPLLLLSVGQFVGMLFGPAGMLMIMTGYQTPQMWIVVGSTLLGLALAILLVGPFGLAGVAAAWGGGAILQGAVSWWYVRRKTGIRCHAWLTSSPVRTGMNG